MLHTKHYFGTMVDVLNVRYRIEQKDIKMVQISDGLLVLALQVGQFAGERLVLLSLRSNVMARLGDDVLQPVALSRNLRLDQIVLLQQILHAQNVLAQVPTTHGRLQQHN